MQQAPHFHRKAWFWTEQNYRERAQDEAINTPGSQFISTLSGVYGHHQLIRWAKAVPTRANSITNQLGRRQLICTQLRCRSPCSAHNTASQQPTKSNAEINYYTGSSGGGARVMWLLSQLRGTHASHFNAHTHSERYLSGRSSQKLHPRSCFRLAVYINSPRATFSAGAQKFWAAMHHFSAVAD